MMEKTTTDDPKLGWDTWFLQATPSEDFMQTRDQGEEQVREALEEDTLTLKRTVKYLVPLLLTLLLFSCSETRKPDLASRFTQDTSKHALTHPIGGMDNNTTDRFILGKSFFRIPWVEAPSATTARDGLGPLFSANTCIACHPGNGAGIAVRQDGRVDRSLVMRLGLERRPDDPRTGFLPDPVYGAQLSINAVHGVAYEGRPTVRYRDRNGTYPDGTLYTLHVPRYALESLNYGPLSPDTHAAAHLAPALVGLGALERIPEAAIIAYEDPEDRDGDGISGRANRVYSPRTNRMELGRFTWKAGAPSVRFQVANAMHNDMGLTTTLYPGENCTGAQHACQDAPRGRHPIDVPDIRLDAVTFYVTSLRIPKQRNPAANAEGAALFSGVGCAKCHVPGYETDDGMTIHPYSDLLLHDMGAPLSDGHRTFRAGPSEFRTPPLWGAGLRGKISAQARYLHDGRARTLEEAVLWHGGEAATVKRNFMALEADARKKLLRFVGSL